MKLNLKRPIIFFDLETTGVDTSKDRIVEISMAKDHARRRTHRQNPQTQSRACTFPRNHTAVHGITDDDVKDCPRSPRWPSRSNSSSGAATSEDSTRTGFDLPVLVEEFLRVGIDVDFKRRKFIDVQNIFHKKKEQRTLVAAYKFYCDKDLDEAHSAEADTLATYEGAAGAARTLSRRLDNDVDMLAEYSRRAARRWTTPAASYTTTRARRCSASAEVPRPFGVRGLRTEPSYYSWMMNGDFPLYTKKVITELRFREKNKSLIRRP